MSTKEEEETRIKKREIEKIMQNISNSNYQRTMDNLDKLVKAVAKGNDENLLLFQVFIGAKMLLKHFNDSKANKTF